MPDMERNPGLPQPIADAIFRSYHEPPEVCSCPTVREQVRDEAITVLPILTIQYKACSRALIAGYVDAVFDMASEYGLEDHLSEIINERAGKSGADILKDAGII